MNSKKKILFIVNPISGVGKQKIIEKLVEQFLDKSIYNFKIVYTNAPKHATELTKQAVAKDTDIVVAVGGDGSVNEVSAGLIGTKTALAIIPTGSGNGLARYLNIPLNLKQAINCINNGKEKQIDSIKINEYTFVNVAGIGFDAHISFEFANYHKRGFLSYLKIILKEFPKYKSQEYELLIGEKHYIKKAFLISFANGSQWGNNAHIAPLADITDGMMDIAILKKITLWNCIPISIKLFRKTLHQSSYLEIMKAKHVNVKQLAGVAHVDGEAIKIGTEIKVVVNPLSLKVIVPN